MRQHHIGKSCPFVAHRASMRREAVRLTMKDCGKVTFIPREGRTGERTGRFVGWAKARNAPCPRVVKPFRWWARFALPTLLGERRIQELAAGDEIIEGGAQPLEVVGAERGL